MTRVLRVPDMSCGHCKATVEQALLTVEGVERASVDLGSKTVSVEHGDAVSEEALREAVSAAGYSVAEVSA
ncbi:MAG: heavy-metal-associated domain-containing protein [Actinomycetota bacterium]